MEEVTELITEGQSLRAPFDEGQRGVAEPVVVRAPVRLGETGSLATQLLEEGARNLLEKETLDENDLTALFARLRR